MTQYNTQKKIAIINDMSGYGRCSITVELPIISALKVQCCPLPTAIFSNHTGYPSYYFDDYTDHMESYMNEWVKLNLQFDGICTGFLGSERQIQIVLQFLKHFKTEQNLTVIDPVMGDHGERYATYTQETCEQMKLLVHYADILTPNLTEACILTDTTFNESFTRNELQQLAQKLSDQGPSKVVITGIQQGKYVSNFCYERGKEGYFVRTVKVGTQRCGTGDIFTSIIAADAVNGVDFHTSVRKASTFVKKCIQSSMEHNIALTDGVCFEELLTSLR